MGIYYQDDTVEIRVYSDEEISKLKHLAKPDLNKKARERYHRDIEKTRKARREKIAIKLTNDPLFKLRHNIRNLIRNSIKKQTYTKNTKTYNILGCTFAEFSQYIEQQFLEGMTWQNYGHWEYDHKIPLSWATTEQEILALNHYTNFQPLWKEDNRSKNNKFNS